MALSLHERTPKQAVDPSAMFSLEALLAIEPTLREQARLRLGTQVPEGGSCVVDLDRLMGREAPRVAAPIEPPKPKPVALPVVRTEHSRAPLIGLIALLVTSFIVLTMLALVRPTPLVIEQVPARDPSLSVSAMEEAINEGRVARP
jgi:hypothetical protein